MRFIKWILFASAVFGVLSFYSYYSSKQAANELVGKSIDYFELTETRIAIEPFEKKLVWSFKFSRPKSTDEGFTIYTALWGSVALTNPSDLENRLRRLEKLGVSPY